MNGLHVFIHNDGVRTEQEQVGSGLDGEETGTFWETARFETIEGYKALVSTRSCTDRGFLFYVNLLAKTAPLGKMNQNGAKHVDMRAFLSEKNTCNSNRNYVYSEYDGGGKWVNRVMKCHVGPMMSQKAGERGGGPWRG